MVTWNLALGDGLSQRNRELSRSIHATGYGIVVWITTFTWAPAAHKSAYASKTSSKWGNWLKSKAAIQIKIFVPSRMDRRCNCDCDCDCVIECCSWTTATEEIVWDEAMNGIVKWWSFIPSSTVVQTIQPNRKPTIVGNRDVISSVFWLLFREEFMLLLSGEQNRSFDRLWFHRVGVGVQNNLHRVSQLTTNDPLFQSKAWCNNVVFRIVIQTGDSST